MIWLKYARKSFEKKFDHKTVTQREKKLAIFGKGLKPEILLKVTPLHGCFSLFLNCTNATKSRNASYVLNCEVEVSALQATKIQKHYLSLSASFLRSENNGIESLNSLSFSSNIWQIGKIFTSRGSFFICFM